MPLVQPANSSVLEYCFEVHKGLTSNLNDKPHGLHHTRIHNSQYLLNEVTLFQRPGDFSTTNVNFELKENISTTFGFGFIS